MPFPFNPAKSIADYRKTAGVMLQRLRDNPGAFLRPSGTGTEWSHAQHVHHSILVAAGILELVEEMMAEEAGGRREPPPPGRRSWAVLPVLVLSFIPRGRGRSPERFLSPATVSIEEIRELAKGVDAGLEELATQSGAIAALPQRRSHPVLGPLTAAEWLRFLAVHTRHHLKIMDSPA